MNHSTIKDLLKTVENETFILSMKNFEINIDGWP